MLGGDVAKIFITTDIGRGSVVYLVFCCCDPVKNVSQPMLIFQHVFMSKPDRQIETFGKRRRIG